MLSLIFQSQMSFMMFIGVFEDSMLEFTTYPQI